MEPSLGEMIAADSCILRRLRLVFDLGPKRVVKRRKERKNRDRKVTVIVTQTQRRLTLVKMR